MESKFSDLFQKTKLLIKRVKLCESKGSFYAIKIVKAKPENLLQETKAMLSLDHPKIIKTIEFNSDGIYKKNDKADAIGPFMVMEFAEKGLLFDYIIFSGRFSEETTRFYLNQLLNGK